MTSPIKEVGEQGSSVAGDASTPSGRTAGLIAKLEKAAAGSRELDAEIVVALDIRPDWCGRGTLWIDYNGLSTGPSIRVNSLGGRNSKGNPPIGDYPAFTTSVDAILALVERELPHWSVDLCFTAGPKKIGTSSRIAGDHLTAEPVGFYHGNKPPALAVCIAFLKARSALQPRAPQTEREGSRDELKTDHPTSTTRGE